MEESDSRAEPLTTKPSGTRGSRGPRERAVLRGGGGPAPDPGHGKECEVHRAPLASVHLVRPPLPGRHADLDAQSFPPPILGAPAAQPELDFES